MLNYFAGPVFTEWYWAPFFFAIFSLLYVALFASVIILINWLISRKKGKDQKQIDKESRRILGTVILMWLIASFVFGPMIFD